MNFDQFCELLETYKLTPEETKPGDESQFVRKLSIQKGQPFSICDRASTRGQKKKRQARMRELRRLIQLAGGVVLQVVTHVGSGKDPSWLEAPAARARKLGAILVTFSVDRFIRHQYFHPTRFPTLRATEAQLQRLRRITGGVPLMTLVPPNTPLSEVRGRYQSLYGKWATGRKGGAPRKRRPGSTKQRRKNKLDEVLLMHRIGLPVRKIALHTNVPRSTVWSWIKKYAPAA